MTDPTLLDLAHAAMMNAPDDASLRLKFYHCLADCELFMLLEEEVAGARILPQVFNLSDGAFVLVFDSEDRLAQFSGATVPYAALSGRLIADLLGDKNIGLGINLNVAPSEILLVPAALAWLTETLESKPGQVEKTIHKLFEPKDLGGTLTEELERQMLRSGGVARAAFLVSVLYQDGATGHLIGFIDTLESARDALAKSVAETLIFSGHEKGDIDVGFFSSDDQVTRALARVGQQIALPKPVAPTRIPPKAPGTDPDNPPIL